MPSYRKDKPERRGSIPQRPRSSEGEEERRPRPSFIRERESSRPGYQELPPRQERDWTEFVVPESERADPNFQYSRIFDIFAPGRRGSPPPPPPPREAPPRAESQRAARPTEPPAVDPSRWFDQGRIWNAVHAAREDRRYRPGYPVAIVQVSPPIPDDARRAEELIRFFGVPASDAGRFRGQELWTRLLNPFLEELTYGLNYGKPREIPGGVKFQKAPDGSFWLAYTE